MSSFDVMSLGSNFFPTPPARVSAATPYRQFIPDAATNSSANTSANAVGIGDIYGALGMAVVGLFMGKLQQMSGTQTAVQTLGSFGSILCGHLPGGIPGGGEPVGISILGGSLPVVPTNTAPTPIAPTPVAPTPVVPPTVTPPTVTPPTSQFPVAQIRPGQISADPQIQQAIRNFAATPIGGNIVNTALSDGTKVLKLNEVANNPGIPANIKNSIINEFQRQPGDVGTTRGLSVTDTSGQYVILADNVTTAEAENIIAEELMHDATAGSSNVGVGALTTTRFGASTFNVVGTRISNSILEETFGKFVDDAAKGVTPTVARVQQEISSVRRLYAGQGLQNYDESFLTAMETFGFNRQLTNVFRQAFGQPTA